MNPPASKHPTHSTHHQDHQDQIDRAVQLEARLVAIELKLDHVLVNFEHLPQSPTCAKELNDITRRLAVLESFQSGIDKKLAWLAGVFAVATSILTLFGRYIVDTILKVAS